MTEAAINSGLSKSKGRVILEYITLALCLCVIALRATFTEGIGAQTAEDPINLGDRVYSLSMSAVLVLSFVIWFVWSFCSSRFSFRLAAIEIGLCLFTIAGIVAGFAAADKRAAITDFVTLLAPVLMAVLLVQILDSQSKIKLVLAVIAGLGVVSAYQCQEQLFYWNEQQIKFYHQNPDAVLAQQGITANSLAHWQFEHRLYSKDVHGFLTTSNSAGSFGLLASFAAVALFIGRFKNRKFSPSGAVWLIGCGLAVAVVIFGLAITRSKGAIIASLIAAAMFIVFLCFGNRLKTHKKVVFIVCLLAVIAGACVVVVYGFTHDGLPGGNSMLVRWQYWRASARMYADHLLTGVGPGNFAHFYPHYKVPSALETVKDPHNLLLTILTQYGPIGLVGFLAMLLMPLSRAAFAGPADSSPRDSRPEQGFRTLAVTFLIVISAVLLVIRPMILKMPPAGSLEEKRAAAILLYAMPVIVFIVGFLLLTWGRTSTKKTNTGIAVAALFCGVVGSLIHNLIDFAIFEPGVLTTFWAIMACLVALDFHQKSRPQLVLKPTAFLRMAIAAAGVALIWAYFNYALIPVAKSTAKIQQAHQASFQGEFERAHSLLAAAAEDDCLSATASSLNGRLYLHHFEVTARKNRDLLTEAEDSLLTAIKRNRAHFRNFERLSEVYTLLAEISTQQEKTNYLNKAFDNALLAVERYPGSGRLRVELAKIAERLGKTNLAIEHYKEAIGIEDGYRRQFRQMYPGRELCSRLGEEKYKFAKQRIKQLSGEIAP